MIVLHRHPLPPVIIKAGPLHDRIVGEPQWPDGPPDLIAEVEAETARQDAARLAGKAP